MIRVGIIGGAGYTAGELIRLLLIHPEVEIKFIHSSSNAGNPITDVHAGLHGETDLVFTDEMPFEEIDLLFFCTAHGDTRKFIESNTLPDELKVIDLSMDYRIKSNDHDFIYGLPELNRRNTCKSRYVANPGGFATCIELGLLPLAKEHLLKGDVSVNAIMGCTGEGAQQSEATRSSWRNNNISVYKAFNHQHLKEIRQSLVQLQSDFDKDINFIPVRGNFSRGIFVSSYIKCDLELSELRKIYADFFSDAAFTFMTEANPDLKQVVNTNKVIIQVNKHGDKVLILTVIDNLLKGASGQAVQNMNLMFGLEETCGLKLKSVAF